MDHSHHEHHHTSQIPVENKQHSITEWKQMPHIHEAHNKHAGHHNADFLKRWLGCGDVYALLSLA